jgi:hypothetical protein
VERVLHRYAAADRPGIRPVEGLATRGVWTTETAADLGLLETMPRMGRGFSRSLATGLLTNYGRHYM